MKLYERYVLPWLIHLAMQTRVHTAERARFVPIATGLVLEVGVGSGLNLPFYGPKVARLYALDPSRELWRLARRRLRAVAFPVDYLAASAEQIPLDDGSVDSVVSTWTLCTIPDPASALGEIKRVLKPDGRFVFVEHGRAPEPGVRRWQQRLDRVWPRIAGGCHLGRQIDDVIAGAGFRVAQIERGYTPGLPRPFGYRFKGLAQRPD